MKQMPLIQGMPAVAIAKRRSWSPPKRRRYEHIPSSFFREMNAAWMIITGEQPDYSRAAKAWAMGWDAYVVSRKEDPLRFSIDLVSCLETVWNRKDHIPWLEAMTCETVVKVLDRYRRGIFSDTVADTLSQLLNGDGYGD